MQNSTPIKVVSQSIESVFLKEEILLSFFLILYLYETFMILKFQRAKLLELSFLSSKRQSALESS